jgi:cellulose synthase/poly-beta-1,6-N-acetylglucosamine synthase-like glycosyltransferase
MPITPWLIRLYLCSPIRPMAGQCYSLRANEHPAPGTTLIEATKLHMWNGKSVSVVFPAYNEEENIAVAVKDFLGVGVVDEVIVVDNNSYDQTAERAREAGGRVISEATQGYGAALTRGLAEAKAELIILAEPDGTFTSRDIIKSWLMRMTLILCAKLAQHAS